MPEFDGALFRASDIDTLVNLNKSAGSQIRGLGIFESVSGATQPTRDSLPSNNRCDGYIAVIKNVDKVYVFNGDPATDWTTSANWSELAATTSGTGLTSNSLISALSDVPAIGSAGEFLAVDSTGSELEYVSAPSGVTNLSTNATTDKLELISSSGNSVDLPAATASTWGVMTDDDKSKLDGIDSAATDDQTNDEIKAAVEAASDSNVFTDADHTKLNAIEANAEVNQTTAEIKSAIGTGNGKLVPSVGTAGHFLRHDGTFGAPSYIANTDTQLSDAEVRAAVEAASDSHVFTDNDHSKLNGIADNATADQSSTEIRNIVQGADLDMGSNDITTTGKILFSNLYNIVNDLPSAYTYHGMFAHVHNTGAAYFAHAGNWIRLANNSDVTGNDADISTNATAIADETTRATAAEGVNATGVSNETTRATAAEGVNATAIANETTRATTAEGVNANNISSNTAHSNIASANPHGTSLGQVSNVSTSGGATNDVLAQNSSGSFDLKNPFDLFMAAAETLGDFPTSGATLGDLDGNGNVGVPDLLLFLANFQSSIFDLSSQSITFTSMSSTPVSIQTSSLNESNYDGQTTLSNLTRLNIGAQTSDNSISPYDWTVNQTNDYIQFYTTDGSDISGSSGFAYFDNAKVQLANPTNLQTSVEAITDDTNFALYCYIETIYSSISTQSQLELVGTYSVNDFDQTISVNQDAENPIVIDHPLFAVNSGDYPTAARIYFYVGIPEAPEYGTFTCSISDLKINITQ